jgi:hypothetical protein
MMKSVTMIMISMMMLSPNDAIGDSDDDFGDGDRRRRIA